MHVRNTPLALTRSSSSMCAFFMRVGGKSALMARNKGLPPKVQSSAHRTACILLIYRLTALYEEATGVRPVPCDGTTVLTMPCSERVVCDGASQHHVIERLRVHLAALERAIVNHAPRPPAAAAADATTGHALCLWPGRHCTSSSYN